MSERRREKGWRKKEGRIKREVGRVKGKGRGGWEGGEGVRGYEERRGEVG